MEHRFEGRTEIGIVCEDVKAHFSSAMFASSCAEEGFTADLPVLWDSLPAFIVKSTIDEIRHLFIIERRKNIPSKSTILHHGGHGFPILAKYC